MHPMQHVNNCIVKSLSIKNAAPFLHMMYGGFSAFHGLASDF